MHRLLRKKGPEPVSPLDDNARAFFTKSPAPPPSPPPVLKKQPSMWKRSKKTVEEEKPAFTLDLALPDETAFRTSLLMPGLSARFSMLKEQYDPNSMLGKASDDSVLQPRRRSRMDMGRTRVGLDDIAEVASMRSGISSLPKPGMGWRQDSFVSEDGYHSESDLPRNGGMMNRSRPGESNVLFGGRQKVSLIPASGRSSVRTTARTVYGDDLSSTPFYRASRDQNSEESRPSLEDHGFDFGLDHVGAGAVDERQRSEQNNARRDFSDVPSLSSSENKWSTDSRNSEARSSTAATSVASQPTHSAASPVKTITRSPNSPGSSPAAAPLPTASSMQSLKRSDTRTRRLYEQGLDQHMHEQQTSALSRLNSIHRQHTLNSKQPPLSLHGTRSASNLNELKQRQQVWSLTEQASPTLPPAMNPLSVRIASSSNASPIVSDPVSPIVQYGSDFEDHHALSQALEPGDRGKATAMGAFNKPKQAFDEHQYNERQLQLQRSASTAALRKKAEVAAPSQVPMLPSSTSDQHLHSKLPPQPSETRPLPARPTARKALRKNSWSSAEPKPADIPLPDTHRTFFGDASGSDDDELTVKPQLQNHPAFRNRDYTTWQPSLPSASAGHPALRLQSSTSDLPKQDSLPRQLTPQSEEPPKILASQTEIVQLRTNLTAEAPAHIRRSHLVHHLRQRSNVSSSTQTSDRTSAFEPFGHSRESSSQQFDLPTASNSNQNLTVDSRPVSYATSNPWDLEDHDQPSNAADRNSRGSISPIETDQQLGAEEARSSQVKNRRSVVSELDAQDEQQSSNKTSSGAQHTRDASTATQQDRDALSNELAARATAIQESIKSKLVSEPQIRDVSPARNSSVKLRALNMLRSRPSRESVEGSATPDVPTIGSPRIQSTRSSQSSAMAARASSSSLPNSRSSAHSMDYSKHRDGPASLPPVPHIDPRMLRQSGHSTTRTVNPGRSRENSDAEPLSAGGYTPPVPVTNRTDTNSIITNSQSRSRAGFRRDDLERAMVDGTRSSTASTPDLAHAGPQEPTPRSTPDSHQAPFNSTRARSGSRGGMTNYFDVKTLQPLASASRERLNSNVPSPALTPTAWSPLPLPSPLSPAGSFAHNMTPPLSGASTPLQQSFSAPPSAPPEPFANHRTNSALRKKTISKGDISEPTLISSTSNFDLVDLPEGASLKNGADEPPPVPPLNPARRATKRILSLGRRETAESGMNGDRAKTPDAYARRALTPGMPFDVAKNRSRSETLSPQKPSINSGRATPNGYPNGTNGSPELSAKPSAQPALPMALDGGMF